MGKGLSIMALKESNKNRKKPAKVVIEEAVLMPNIRAVTEYKHIIIAIVIAIVVALII
jgi:hypothetical protein